VFNTGVILADRYRLDEPIAAGGVGQVWRATDQVLQRRVAVKLLRPEYADHPDTLARFRAEARHAGSLAHPAIAQVYDYGDSPFDGPPYLVMELVDGPSLADVLATEPVTPAYALDVLAKAAAGLAAAHEAGLVHRDIKPGNILLGPDGEVKITDFGIAHAVGSAPVTDPGLVMGTTQYLAPERIAGGSGAPAADLYSLGIVMHECLTGLPPYQGTPAEVMAGHLYSPLPPLPAGTPYEVEDLIARLTAKDPEQRLSDAGELAALARTVHTAITSGGTAPRPRQTAALSPVGGVTAPGGLATPHSPFDGSPVNRSPVNGGPVNGGPVNGGRPIGGSPIDGSPVPAYDLAPWESPNPSGPGTELVLRGASTGRGVVAVREPRRGYGTAAGPDPRTVVTDPFNVEDDLTGGHARPRLTGLRQAGQLLSTERPRSRRRAAIGIGVLVLAGGAGLTGAVATGALHTSPVANRTVMHHPSLSAVQPNADGDRPGTAVPGKSGKHRKPYAAKHAKTTGPSPSASTAPATTNSPAPGPSTPPASSKPNPQPSASQSTPVCLLGVLCSS
jgi:serine/threonine-protein kinase